MIKCFFYLLFAFGYVPAFALAGIDGSIAFGGPLNAKAPKSNAWTVKTYSTGGLSIDVSPGDKSKSFTVPRNIPILGIKTVGLSRIPFGSPQINLHGAIDSSKFKSGKTKLSVPLLSAKDGSVIGNVSVSVVAAGLFTGGEGHRINEFVMFSRGGSYGFNGGLPLSPGTTYGGNAWSLANNFDTSIVAGYSNMGGGLWGHGATNFNNGNVLDYNGGKMFYFIGAHAFYSMGVLSGETMVFNFNSPVNDSVEWKANIPITITYSW